MTDTQHTPGPWRVEIESNGYMSVCADGLIADLDYKSENAIADARMIAACPEMLDALAHIEWAVTGFGDFEAQYPEAIAAVRAAITKATGQTLWRPAKAAGMSL